jgi:hypothetical protein
VSLLPHQLYFDLHPLRSVGQAIGKINEASHPMHYVKRANFTPNKAHSEMKQMEMEGGSP